ncbi:MAG: hypothetical protein A2096_12635 [Spirochaetes bacterium GWF1_41_5]|nr:MAG: hypothetical protein A2096_12635 [Spirochaetes bacterium GWF1_41_5]HBD95749.1 hypothetical protein [Spirochaetia bacterium]
MSKAVIYYHDIGDYLPREEKLKVLRQLKSIANPEIPWKILSPNEHGDWISQRNEGFENYIPMAPEKKFDLRTQTIFSIYAIGISTNRDSWVYNYNQKTISKKMSGLIAYYNQQQVQFQNEKQKKPDIDVADFIENDTTQISWTRSLKNDVKNGVIHNYTQDYCTNSLYRPFCIQNLYFHKPFIESPGLSSTLFPREELENKIIVITGIGASKDFSIIISNKITNLDTLEKSQCFPLYYYEEKTKESPTLFDAADGAEGDNDYIRRDSISDFILDRAKKQYGKNVTKEDIFYYVYGFLHCPEYRRTFANDLKKMLPRLPLVENVKNFWAFSKAGRKLADLHINYEEVPAYPDLKVTGNDGASTSSASLYLVEKMRFPKKDRKDTIIYNSKITISNIPEKAYEYVVNGKSAIEWIMERYQITVHKESGIKNDPNDWAKEHDKPRYILDLLLSIINVSMQTVDIVKGLPKVSFE